MSPLEIALIVGAVLFVAFCGFVGLILVAVGARRHKQAAAVLRPFSGPFTAPAQSPVTLRDQLAQTRRERAEQKAREELDRAEGKLFDFAFAEDAAPKS